MPPSPNIGQGVTIIGIDPGLARTGWGVLRFDGADAHYVASGYCSSASSHALPVRLHAICSDLQESLTRYTPDYAAVEQTFLNSNAKSSLVLGHMRGALLVTLAFAAIPVAEYSATSVKKTIAGNGRADKSQLAAMLHYLIKGYTLTDAPHDETDALAVALCQCRHLSWNAALARA